MEPFPAYKRRIYFFLFAVLFVILLPAVILYADGWRFKSGIGLVQTGGIYIDVPYTDATISVNDAYAGRSGFLQHTLYIDDLAPAAYSVRVEKPGFRSWNRLLIVEPKLVTDSRSVLLPDDVMLTRLVLAGNASSTRIIPQTEYAAFMTAFATSTVASSTKPIEEENTVALYVVDGDVIVEWMGANQPPSIFCISPSLCETEMSIKRIGGPATDARFFGGGVVYHTQEGGVYFTEIDIRPTAVSAQLYAAPETDMRIIDGALIIKSGELLYEVESF
jgi:hypothetical protein